MESALTVALCGRVTPAQPCDGRGGGVRDDPSSPSSLPPAPAPLLLITDRLDTPGGAGAAVFDRAWSELAAGVASGRAQASRVAALALERPPAVYRGGAALPASLLLVVDGYTDPFGWVGGQGAGGQGNRQRCHRIDDLAGLARALRAGGGDQPDSDDNNSLLIIIDSLSALLARHVPLDVLRWLESDLLRSPRVSAVLAMLHSDEEGPAARVGPAADGDSSSISAAFEALSSACLQLRPLTPAQRDLSGADGELRVVCRRRGLGGQAGVLMAAAVAAARGDASAAPATTSAVDSTRAFGGAGRPRAERLLYTLGSSGWDEEADQQPPSAARWRRAAIALAPMPREVAAPDARALAARAAERTVSMVAQQQLKQQRASSAAAAAEAQGAPPPGGQRHDRLAARGRATARAWAPLGGAGEDNADAAAAPSPAHGPGRILFERDSGGSSAESGADPDEDLEI